MDQFFVNGRQVPAELVARMQAAKTSTSQPQPGPATPRARRAPPAQRQCSFCPGQGELMGVLGRVAQYRCRDCGTVFHRS